MTILPTMLFYTLLSLLATTVSAARDNADTTSEFNAFVIGTMVGAAILHKATEGGPGPPSEDDFNSDDELASDDELDSDDEPSTCPQSPIDLVD